MNKYIEGFVKLKIIDDQAKTEKYEGPEVAANKIQKCSILKTSNIAYSSTVKYTEPTT